MKNQSKSIVIYNFTSGLLYQIILLVSQFVERKFFISVLGAEILGISASMMAIVAVASLAEMGMGTVIIFHLYKPLENGSYNEVSQLLSIYKRIYNLIALLVMCGSVIILPFLGIFLGGVQVTIAVYIYFILIATNTAASYLLSYKRCLLIADRKDYHCKIVDGLFNIVFCIIKICALVFAGNFTLYLTVAILQTVGANLMIAYLCRRNYPKVKGTKFNGELFKRLMPDFKDLFMGQLAAYLFNSSDNIIISTFVNAVSVGLLAGYTMVTKSVKTLILSLFGAFGTILGRMIVKTKSGDSKRCDAFNMYCYSIFFITVIIIIPEFILFHDFVANVWGLDYVMTNKIVWLLVAEQYITLVQDPCGVYIVANGEFKKCRNADAVAAISNIVLSLVLVQFYDIEGVLFATIVSRILQWLLKAYYVNIFSMQLGVKGFIRYWINNIYKIVLVFITLFVMNKVTSLISIGSFVPRFVVSGFITVSLTAIIVVACTFFLSEFKLSLRFMLKKQGE